MGASGASGTGASSGAKYWQRGQWVGAVALVVGSLGFLILRAGSEAVPFISQDPARPWLQPPAGVSATLQQWGRADVPVARFVCHLTAQESGAPLTLRMRALGAFSVWLNGQALPGAAGDGSEWRRERDFVLALAPGANQIAIDIANRHGPPLLSARVVAAKSSARPCALAWVVEWEGNELGPAMLADDTRVNPLAYTVETPGEALERAAAPLAAAFAFGAFGYLALGRVSRARELLANPRLGFGIAGLAWSFVFVDKFVEIPLRVGFDARHHLFYVDFLREQLAVPLATDGWSVYHPPLFYALAGFAQALGEALAAEAGAAIGLKLIPFLAGVGNIWIAAALCGRLFPRSSAVAYALLFGAVLPMNLYTAAYFSNETFHTFVAGLAILLVVDLLLSERARSSQVVALGVLLGVGLVTKFTALLVTAVGGFFLLVKWLGVDGQPLLRCAGRLVIVGGLASAIAGWFYVRNWMHFGDPLMANWGAMPGPTLAWWQQPGFHTLTYFTGFGESLQHPYLSAFHSFWDSVYSTLWGDGGIAGRVAPLDRIAVWNYTLMSAGYWIAVPATGLIALGAGRALFAALRDPDPRRRAAFSFLLTFVYAVGFGLLYLALRLPYFAQGKASYGLVVAAPLALFFAMGSSACERWLREPGALRVALAFVFYGWLGVFGVSMFFAYAG
jgi:hypothetical protein